MQCPRCRQDNPVGLKFCGACGTPLVRPDESGPPAASYAELQRDVEHLARALSEALEQQTATSEILRVISSSPTDVQPVLDAVARSAARLCETDNVSVYLVDGSVMRRVAGHGSVHPAAIGETRPITRGSASGRAIVERQVVHVEDLAAARESEFPDIWPGALAKGVRNAVAVPLLREGTAIGAISAYRVEARPFSAAHIALLQTFADQAVIAIENVRLFKELEARNRDLTEALEQQTATSEILRVIASSPTELQPVLDVVAKNAARVCGAHDTSIALVEANEVRRVAWYSTLQTSPPTGSPPLRRDSIVGRAVLDARTIHIPDVVPLLDTEYPATRQAASASGTRTVLVTPLLRQGVPIGTILIRRLEVRPFTDRQIELLKTFADQAVIAIENVRLFEELEARNRALSESLERQTATAEILRVISASPTDVQPVFEIIAERAMKLCDAEVGVVSMLDGELIQLAAIHGWTREDTEAVRRAFPMGLNTESVTARAMRHCAVVHIQDVLAEPLYRQRALALQDAGLAARYRLALGVPMVRERQVIGAIFVARAAPGQFSDRQVQLLQTFSDQAVIAIQNVRLFKELEARNRDLSEALEQQTATSDILRVISSSPTDLQPVFDTIAEHAMRLCSALHGVVLRFDRELIHLAALANASPEGGDALRGRFPTPPGRHTAGGRAILTGAMIHILRAADGPGVLRGVSHAALRMYPGATHKFDGTEPAHTFTDPAANLGRGGEVRLTPNPALAAMAGVVLA